MTSVNVVEAERMNLLGLMLSNLLIRKLEDPVAARHARALSGDVVLEASGMQITLRFEPDRIEVTRGGTDHPRAHIHGTLTALLGAALGRDRVRSVLRRELVVRGNPVALWHLLALVRA